jgi:60 kDa SS-A/Ro ribonucleoprotein
MASKTLFQSIVGRLFPRADTRNQAGGPAYSLSGEQALAQYATTGCLNATYYADAREQLAQVLVLCEKVRPEFIARVAVHAREKGGMKDMPALLAAVLAVKAPVLLARIFPRVVDTPRMLRNFVQIVRSGAAGRKSLGSLPKRLVREWLSARSDEALFRASVGQSPSLADIIKMVHPRPENPARAALYGYLIGRGKSLDSLPALVQAYEGFKADRGPEVPDVPFEMLTALALGRQHWASIAERAPWQMTRMNLNTFARHGVFKGDPRLQEIVARRLRCPDAVRKARAFPYQLLVAYRMADKAVPENVRDALQDALEVAIDNVPEFAGQVHVCLDVSGSMRSPVTGARKGATTRVQCVDVAALVAAAIARQNPGTEILPFSDDVVPGRLNPRDSVLTQAALLASLGGGGTNAGAPLALLNELEMPGDLVVYVSDNQSWIDAGAGRGTATMKEWARFKARNPRAKLALIDIQPYATTQAPDRDDILNVGGFSDGVFDVLGAFARGELGAAHWVEAIDKVEI